jgi:hypothetical protein
MKPSMYISVSMNNKVVFILLFLMVVFALGGPFNGTKMNQNCITNTL